MKVFYLPHFINTTDEAIPLEWPVSVLMKYARRRKSYRDERDSIGDWCHRCGASIDDAHHIKPIWACAIEYIMANCPTSKIGADQIAKVDNIDGGLVDKWHSSENLLPLCRQCHLMQQSYDDSVWKIRLANRYRLTFSIRWATLFDGTISLQKYIDWYISKEYKGNL